MMYRTFKPEPYPKTADLAEIMLSERLGKKIKKEKNINHIRNEKRLKQKRKSKEGLIINR